MRELGGKGLEEVNLYIPQSTSFTFDIVHEDDSGDIFDHSNSTAHMMLVSKGKNPVNYRLDQCCACTAEYIRVNIPAIVTDMLPIGKYDWDIIVVTELGEQIRIVYGVTTIYDSYAMDEV